MKNIEVCKNINTRSNYERERARGGESRDTVEMIEIKIIRGFKIETKELNKRKNVFSDDKSKTRF